MMKWPHTITRLFLACSVLLLAFTLTPLLFAPAKAAKPLAAQAPAQRQLISIQFLRLKPGMAPEWREFRKNETLPMLKKAGVKQQTLWSTAVFGDGTFLIVTPIESLAQYDGPSPAVRALGQEGATALAAKTARFIESSHTIAIETRPDLSLLPASSEPAKLIVVATSTLTQGHAADYESFVKTQVLPVVKKATPKGYLVSQVVYGGNVNQFITATLLDSFADLHRYREVFNKESTAARLTGKGVGIMNRENTVYRYVADLSLMPAPAK